jgi:flagellar motor component MotA
MSQNPAKNRKVEAHLQLLGTLFLILGRIRTYGLLSIEADIEDPENSPLFNSVAAYDKANDAVYTVLCDTLRLMLYGNLDADGIKHYLTAYRKTAGLSEVQESLFETIRLMLIARLENHTPQIAAEFGRQGIPAQLKPSFTELEVFLKDLSRDHEGIPKTYQDVEAALDNFYASLETDR